MVKKIFSPIVLSYLRVAAHIQLAKSKAKIIGVAGSSGKSSLVSLIGGMLSEKYSVKQSQGKNSETGLPLDILGIHMRDFSPFAWLIALIFVPIKLLFNWGKYDIYVAEMGIDSPVEPKNMSYLLKIIQPSIGVVTNVTYEHSEYFEQYVDEINPEKKEEKILAMTAEQETMLLTTLDTDEVAIINLDDPWIDQVIPQIDAKKISVSLKRDADLLGKDISVSFSRFSMVIEFEKKNYPLTVPHPLPIHFANEFLLALAVGISFELSITDCIEFIQKHFSLPPGRLSIFKGIKNTTIIDSTYNNATLPPIIDILHMVKEISGKRRKIAILGDMRELGIESEKMHAAVAKEILTTVDFAVLIGPMSEQYMVPILRKAEFPFENFLNVTSSEDAIKRLIQEDDIILVKGSQNTLFLERIVEMLLADKEDREKLTRRGEFWDKKRSESL